MPCAGKTPPYGALVSYYLKSKPDDKTKLKLQIIDSAGKMISEIENIAKERGLNRVRWNLRHGGPPGAPPADRRGGSVHGRPARASSPSGHVHRQALRRREDLRAEGRGST